MAKLIGNAPNQVPTNADLGSMAFEDRTNYITKGASVHQPYRNIIINGDMSIAQRGTSFSVVDNIYTLDRFLTEFSGFGAFTLTQSTDAPDGFGYSLKLDCTTADASPASGDIFQLFHKIEGQNLQYLKKGTASAVSTTLSFWVKSNKTGNMQVNLRDANSRIIGGVYTINSANTWEKKTLTFVGDTSGTLANNNTVQLTLEFPIGSGSNYSSGSVPTSWEAVTTADRNAGSTINLADSTANEWYITGIQLEAGTTASDFEFLPFDVNENRCLRYFYKDDCDLFMYTNRVSDAVRAGQKQFPVPMRSAPTFTSISDTEIGNTAMTDSSRFMATFRQSGNDGLVPRYNSYSFSAEL